MSDYRKTLHYMAKKIGLPPDLLHNYLHGTLPPAKEAIIAPKSRQIELGLTDEGDGVFYCLLTKSNHAPQTPVTVVDFIAPMLQGIYERCVESRYGLQYLTNHHNLATADYFRSILDKNPGAAVLLLIPQRTETIATVCAEMNRYCLMIDYLNTAKQPIYSLNVNNCQAVLTMTERLIELGHTRIGFITGKMDLASAQQRYSGYRSALKSADIPYDEALVKYGNWRIDTGQALTEELLALPDPPTAVVCSNDLTALGAYGAIKTAGLGIPNDISVVGFDGIPFVATIDPPLTTVRQPLKTMGRTAASLLIDALEGHPSDTFTHEHPLELVWGSSIGPAAR